MSVSDPLVKDLKGCVQQFLKLTDDKITDNHFYFILLCQTIEKIFDKGLIRQQNTKYFDRIIDSYAWMAGVSKSDSDIISFAYADCVEKVKARKDVRTNDGRFRLLVKFCLVKKCLHVPVEFLKKSGNNTIFYTSYSSIIGDEILSEILLSVLLQMSRINFLLDLENACFLDVNWYIPELINLELVPSKNLGVSVRQKKSGNNTIFYTSYSSIIGDEILSEILLSVLLQMSRINFLLDLENACFLDVNWYIPELINLELVPSKNLGVSVSFSDNRAVVVNVESNSVAAESGVIKIGDVLDKLNGVHITSALKGKLGSLLRNNKNKPITLTIAKAFNNETKEMYSPIEKLYKYISIDVNMVKKQYEEGFCEKKPKKLSSGYEVDYVGTVDLGECGSVKKVHMALKCMLCQSNNADLSVTHVGKSAIFEIGEIGVKIKDIKTGDIFLEHSYMKISACGNLVNIPHVFGYSAGDQNCDIAEKFVCHIFEVKKSHDAETILQSLGQGFHRTHFAV